MQYYKHEYIPQDARAYANAFWRMPRLVPDQVIQAAGDYYNQERAEHDRGFGSTSLQTIYKPREHGRRGITSTEAFYNAHECTRTFYNLKE
ncbi:hypothetical protein TRAPUB_1328, partial [Trametes pubescens]